MQMCVWLCDPPGPGNICRLNNKGGPLDCSRCESDFGPVDGTVTCPVGSQHHCISKLENMSIWFPWFFFFYGMVLCIMLDKPRWRYLAGKQVDESICTNWLEFINKLVLYLIKTELLAWSGQEEKTNLIVVSWSAWGAPFICTLSVNSLFLFTAPLTLCCMAKLPARPLSEAMSPHHVCPSGL